MRTHRLIAVALAALALAGFRCNREELCPAVDQMLCTDGCRTLAIDRENCGACGHACAAGEECSGGLCRCPDGRADCDGICVDAASDPANCGSCGAVCAGETVCTTDAAGTASCQASCAQPSQTACGRACVALATDIRNCGACGRACATNERCDAGACAADLYLACWNSDEVREATRDLEPAGLPIGVAPGPSFLAVVDDTLYLASARYTGLETISAIRRDPPEVRVEVLRQLSGPYQDVQALAAHRGLLYVSHSSVGTLVVLRTDGTVVDEIVLLPADAPPDAPNPNPQGIAFVGDEAWVALNARNEVVVLDVSGMAACARGDAMPPCASEVARVDVQPLASAGGRAMPSALAAVGGRVFAALWNLAADFSVPPASTGRLAAIDAATHRLDPAVNPTGSAGLVDLSAACLNPAALALAPETPTGQKLWVTCGAFAWPSIVGSGVVAVNVSANPPTVDPVLPASPADAPGRLAFCGGTGYVGDRNSGRVFRLDPAAGIVDGTELCPVSGSFAYVSDLACGF